MRKKEIQEKLDAIVEFAGIQRYLDTPVKRYSSGMYVRLAFAVAVHLDPDILIIDEVLAVGDSEFQNKCIGKMKNVSDQGRTVIFVSHTMTTVKSLCTRAIYLDQGKVALEGSTDEVVWAYNKDNMLANIHSRELVTPHLRGGDGKVRFNKVELLNVNGETTFEYLPHDKVIVHMEVVINEPIEILHASVAFRSSKTHDFVTTNKCFLVPIGDKKIGVPFKFDIIINDLNLNPGVYPTHYQLVFDNDVYFYDVLDSVLPPLIVNLPPGKENNQFSNGYFMLDSEIKLH
jgi:lipopolysaccharide transport system ATP-binding protein